MTSKDKEIKNIYKIFKPELTPKRMLEMGVFGGSYFDGKIKEYPKSWFINAKLSKSFDVEKKINLNKSFEVEGYISITDKGLNEIVKTNNWEWLGQWFAEKLLEILNKDVITKLLKEVLNF